MASKWNFSSKSTWTSLSICQIIFIFLSCYNCFNLVLASHNHEDPNHQEGDESEFIDCEIAFENEDMRMRVRDECNKTNPVAEDKLLENYPVHSTLENFEFDDNCFTSCVYRAEKIMSEDGTLDREEVQHFFKSNMTSELFTKLTSIFYACIDTTNRIADKKALGPCKKASLHEFCVVKGIVASAHEILKMDC